GAAVARPGASNRDEFEAFAAANRSWLDDYARFMAVKESVGGGSWTEWPEGLRRRDDEALEAVLGELLPSVTRYKVWQYWFFRQWRAVRDYAHQRGVRIIGDVPIFVSLDSADSWSNPESFHFDDEGRPTVVAGVPPDYFSATGQRWGNPLYRWDVMREDGF